MPEDFSKSIQNISTIIYLTYIFQNLTKYQNMCPGPHTAVMSGTEESCHHTSKKTHLSCHGFTEIVSQNTKCTHRVADQWHFPVPVFSARWSDIMEALWTLYGRMMVVLPGIIKMAAGDWPRTDDRIHCTAIYYEWSLERRRWYGPPGRRLNESESNLLLPDG